MNSWNSLDFIIFLIFVTNTLLGMVRGASREIISTMCLSVALIFVIKFTVPVANFFNSSPAINDVVDNQTMQNFMIAIGAGPITASLLKEIFYSISMLICFVGSFSICEAMLSYTGFVETFSFPYATLNRKVGAALGFGRGYIFNLLFIAILALHLLKNNDVIGNNNIVNGSFFVNLLGPSARKLDSLITGQKPESYREILQEKPAYNVEDLYKTIKNTPDNPLQQQHNQQPTNNNNNTQNSSQPLNLNQ